VPRGDVEDIEAVVAQGALSGADYDNLVTDHNRGACATRRQQVSLHLGMGPGNKKGDGRSIGLPPKNLGIACVSHPARTDIETPPKITSIVAATKYPRHLVHEGDHVRAKAMVGERTPDRNLAPVHHGRGRRLDVMHIWETGDST